MMSRFIVVTSVWLVAAPCLLAQQVPSYAKQVRPFLAKYCLECHNAKTMKGSLNLETYKEMMDGSDAGPVIVAGKPNDSRLVLLTEHLDKPAMPPAKAKFQPSKAEIKLVRAWVAAGAKDDSAASKVELPAIKSKTNLLPPVRGVAYEPRQKIVAIIRGHEFFRLGIADIAFPPRAAWRSEREITALTLPSSEALVATDYSPEGSFLVAVGGVRYAFLPKANNATILDLASNTIAKVIAAADYNGQIAIFELGAAEKPLHVLKEHSDAVYGVTFNSDGTLLASVSADRAMKVFDVETGTLLYTLGESTDWLYAVAWSPNGKYLVSGGVDKSIRVYEPTRTGAKLRQSVFAHEGPVQKLVFSSDSKTLYSVGQDRIIKAWDVERMVERKIYEPQPETVLCLALREDAQQLIVGRYDGIVQLLDIKTGKVMHEFGKPEAPRKAKKLAPVSFEAPKAEPIPATDAGSSPATGQKINLPATIISTLERAGAMHYFRFEAKKGQQLGMQITPTGKGAKFDPVLVVADMAGRLLAESHEGHLGITFVQDGSYAVGVRDRDYRGGAELKYHLKLGEIPVVTSIYPLGLRQGQEGLIHLAGVFLDQKQISFKIPPTAVIGSKVSVPVTSKYGVPLGKPQLVVGEFPDFLESAYTLEPGYKIPIPGTANGRLLQDGQKHTWSFAAKKGTRLVVEVHARRLGSRLDSIIEILDANNQPVPRAVLRSQAKTYVTFRDHDSAAAGIRIEAWSELSTNDFLYVGNELMKIQSLPTHPDADCIFFSTAGQRLGYFDTTPTHHSNNSPMYKVTLHPPGTKFAPNGYPVFTLYYRNDDGGPGHGRDSRILFDPPADGEYKVRVADARGLGGDNFGYRLTVRPPRPSFQVRFTPTNPILTKGGALPLTIAMDRIDGYEGPIDVRFENLPPGFSAPPTTIEAGTYSTAVALHADADAKLPAKMQPFKLIGEAMIDGKQERKEAVGDLTKLIEPGDIVTTTVESEIAIKPGEQTKLTVRIARRNGFTGRVPLEVRGLPHGVRVLDIGLNGILVTERETQRTVALYAEPWVQPSSRPIVVLARREGKNTEHAAKAVMLTVR